MNGAELIAWERQRQIDVEGWTDDHDDHEHTGGELIQAAVAYALASAPDSPCSEDTPADFARTWWPWEEGYWNPSADPVRNLVKAGALIAAEIDRVQRDGSETIPWTDGSIPPHGFEDEWAAIQRDKGLVVVPDDEHVWRLG